MLRKHISCSDCHVMGINSVPDSMLSAFPALPHLILRTALQSQSCQLLCWGCYSPYTMSYTLAGL